MKKFSLIIITFILLFNSKIFSQPLPSASLGQYCFEKRQDGLYLRLEVCQPWQFGNLIPYFVAEKNNPTILMSESYRSYTFTNCSSPYVGLYVYFNLNNYPSVLNSVNNPIPPNVAPYMDFCWNYVASVFPIPQPPFYPPGGCNTIATEFCEPIPHEPYCNSHFKVDIQTKLQGTVLSGFTFPFSVEGETNIDWLNNSPVPSAESVIKYEWQINDGFMVYPYTQFAHSSMPYPTPITFYGITPSNYNVKLKVTNGTLQPGLSFPVFYVDFLNQTNLYGISKWDVCNTEYNFCLGDMITSDDVSNIPNKGINGIDSEINSINEIKIYPNPSNDGNFKIDLNNIKGKNVKIEVLNLESKVVYSKLLNTIPSDLFNEELMISNLNSGLYFCIIHINNEKHIQKLVIK